MYIVNEGACALMDNKKRSPRGGNGYCYIYNYPGGPQFTKIFIAFSVLDML